MGKYEFWRIYTSQCQSLFRLEKSRIQDDAYGDPPYVVHIMQYYHIDSNNVVQIAQSQIGNIGGRLYWSWYGFNNCGEGCACFVSWVINEVELIENGSVPKFAYCPTGIQWFKEHQQWKPIGSIPQPGNIIFFDWENDGICDECRQRNYPVGSMYIVGYGIIIK